MHFVNMVEEAIDLCEKKITWTELAETAGLTKSALSHWKSGAEINFISMLKISKLVSSIFRKDILKDFCNDLQKPKNLRHALEYLAINNYTTELEKLIMTIREKHTNRELLDWADTYEIILEFLQYREIPYIMYRVRNFNPKTYEMKILVSFIEIYCHYFNKEYKTMMSLCKGLKESINEIEDEFINKSYNYRMTEIEANIYLHYYNQPKKAREFAYKIINSDFELGLKFVSNSYYIVGMSYLFEDFDKCISYILAYRDICEKLGCTELVAIVDNRDIPFIYNVWRKHNECPITNDISEIAHYEALNGNRETALKLIDQSLKQGVTGFKLYYKALATQDKNIFMQSLIIFAKNGEKFFARLPYKHLVADPSFKQMADLLLEE